MINKNVNKIFKNFKNLELIKNLNLKARPQELEPQKYYEITELFEKI